MELAELRSVPFMIPELTPNTGNDTGLISPIRSLAVDELIAWLRTMYPRTSSGRSFDDKYFADWIYLDPAQREPVMHAAPMGEHEAAALAGGRNYESGLLGAHAGAKRRLHNLAGLNSCLSISPDWLRGLIKRSTQIVLIDEPESPFVKDLATTLAWDAAALLESSRVLPDEIVLPICVPLKVLAVAIRQVRRDHALLKKCLIEAGETDERISDILSKPAGTVAATILYAVASAEPGDGVWTSRIARITWAKLWPALTQPPLEPKAILLASLPVLVCFYGLDAITTSKPEMFDVSNFLLDMSPWKLVWTSPRTAQRVRSATRKFEFHRFMPRQYGYGEIVRRPGAMMTLSKALEDEHCAILCIIAEGGFGKSSLVNAWLQDIEDVPPNDLRHGFAYSFSNQGDDAHPVVASSEFFANSLSFLDPDGEQQDRGLHLLKLFQTKQMLLVLDGLEPLQRREGDIDDEELQAFVKGALNRPAGGSWAGSLCVLTSRVMPAELVGHSARIWRIDLGPLDLNESVRLLLNEGLHDNHPELEQWADEAKGHPLLLTMLAPKINQGYTVEDFRHVVTDDTSDQPTMVRRFARSYIRNDLRPEAHCVLNSLCLFDRPIFYPLLCSSLVEQAVIPGFTDALWSQRDLLGRRFFSEQRFLRAVKELDRLHIITAVNVDDPQGMISISQTLLLEVHPLIQAGIRADLINEKAQACKKAHWTIYKSLAKAVKPRQPDDRVKLVTLYTALSHGVRAGRGQWVGWVYAFRCLRNLRAYSTNRHGMMAYDKALMSLYFTGYWEALRDDLGLNAYAQTHAYVWSGIILYSLNQRKEGVRLLAEGRTRAEKHRNFVTASRATFFIAFINALEGNFADAERYATEALELLGRRRPLWLLVLESRFVNLRQDYVGTYVTFAAILHYQGKFKEAEAMVRKAQELGPLVGLWCFQQVEMLLDMQRFDESEDLIRKGLSSSMDNHAAAQGVFSDPILKVVYIRAKVRRADLLQEQLQESETIRNYARELERFGEKDYDMRMDYLVPLIKIALAGVARHLHNLSEARMLIDAAQRWAEKNGHVVYRLDDLIERARIFMAEDNRENARRCVEEAYAIREALGFKCKDVELQRLRSALCYKHEIQVTAAY